MIECIHLQRKALGQGELDHRTDDLGRDARQAGARDYSDRNLAAQRVQVGLGGNSEPQQ
jgi:hypothetical protein